MESCAISVTGAIFSVRRTSAPWRKIPRLLELGVLRVSKSEGRLNIAGIRRRRHTGLPQGHRRRAAVGRFSVTGDDRYQLEMTFSRGLFTGWMHASIIRSSWARALERSAALSSGAFATVGRDWVELDRAGAWLQARRRRGLSTLAETPSTSRAAAFFEMSGTRLAFQRGKVDFSKINAGDRVWKTSDQVLDSRCGRHFPATSPAPNHSAAPACRRPRRASGFPFAMKSAASKFSQPCHSPRRKSVRSHLKCCASN
jgi:putative protease